MWALGGPVQASAGCAREYGGLTCKSMWKLGGTVGAEPRGACAYRGLPSRESSACMSIAGRPWECSGWGAHPGAAAGRARTGAAPSWASAGCGLPRRRTGIWPFMCMRRPGGQGTPAPSWASATSMLHFSAVLSKHVALFGSSEQACGTLQQFPEGKLHFSAVPTKHVARFRMCEHV